jgi:exonuclease SbcD
MIRLVHFSDLHLGSDSYGRPNPSTGINQRIHDFAARLDELIDFAFDNDVDLVLFAGDAFKNAHPTPTVQKLLAERVWRLAKGGIKVFVLAGNHDLPRMVSNVTAFSVYPALEVPGVVVAERADVHDVQTKRGETIQIAAIPHFWRSTLRNQIDRPLSPQEVDRAINGLVAAKVGALAERVNPALPAILTAHVHVDKARISTAQELYGISEFQVPLSSIANHRFGYIALGHIHKRQELSDEWRSGSFVAYSGSLDRVDFGEEDEEKGFYVVDLEAGRPATRPHFQPVDARRFLTVQVSPVGDDPTPEVRAAIEAAGVADAIVRVKVRAPRDRYALLDQALVRTALEPAYDARVMPDHEEAPVTVRDPRFSEAMSYAEALEAYARGEFGADADDVIRLGTPLIDEVLGA